METINSCRNLLNVFALLLVLPTTYFTLAGILSEFEIKSPINTIQSTEEKWGIREGFGWNIKLLNLFGPVLAFLLAIFQVLKVQGRSTKEEFLLHFIIRKRLYPLIVAVISTGLIGSLFIYSLGEKCLYK